MRKIIGLINETYFVEMIAGVAVLVMVVSIALVMCGIK